MTTADKRKARLIELFRLLLTSYKSDIESGVEDGTYLEEDNVETRAMIAEAEIVIAEFTAYIPDIYLYFSGGNLKRGSGTEYINIETFDKDEYDAEGAEQREVSPDEWDKMIKDKTEKLEIKGIY